MSGYLVATSLVTGDLRARPRPWQPGGPANGRALAYLAHEFLGNAFGTVYDVSSILILWFAGASAMAGLINIVPRYLPGYGMAPEWSRAVRPVTLVYTGVAVLITWLFDANVDAQAGAYATGILAMMISAAFAVTVSRAPARQPRGRGRVRARHADLHLRLPRQRRREARRDRHLAGVRRRHRADLAGLPAGPGDRAARGPHRVRRDGAADHRRLPRSTANLHLIANKIQAGDHDEYRDKEAEQRALNPIPENAPILFLEIAVSDPSEFSKDLLVRGVKVDGHRILRAESTAVPNALAAIMLRAARRHGPAPAPVLPVVGGQPAGAPRALRAVRPGRDGAGDA